MYFYLLHFQDPDTNYQCMLIMIKVSQKTWPESSHQIETREMSLLRGLFCSIPWEDQGCSAPGRLSAPGCQPPSCSHLGQSCLGEWPGSPWPSPGLSSHHTCPEKNRRVTLINLTTTVHQLCYYADHYMAVSRGYIVYCIFTDHGYCIKTWVSYLVLRSLISSLILFSPVMTDLMSARDFSDFARAPFAVFSTVPDLLWCLINSHNSHS